MAWTATGMLGQCGGNGVRPDLQCLLNSSIRINSYPRPTASFKMFLLVLVPYKLDPTTHFFSDRIIPVDNAAHDPFTTRLCVAFDLPDNCQAQCPTRTCFPLYRKAVIVAVLSFWGPLSQTWGRRPV